MGNNAGSMIVGGAGGDGGAGGGNDGAGTTTPKGCSFGGTKGTIATTQPHGSCGPFGWATMVREDRGTVG